MQFLTAPPGNYTLPKISPDGTKIAIGTYTYRSNQIYIYDTSNDRITRLTFAGNSESPVWTPDGKHIAYQSERASGMGIFWKPADGTGIEETLLTNAKEDSFELPISFTPDGRVMAYIYQDTQNKRGFRLLSMDGERKPNTYLQTTSFTGSATFSPDGRWIAYTSDESGRYEVYVRPYPGPGGPWQVSAEGGQQPRWARNGRELFYLDVNDQGKIFAVDISGQPSFSAGKPHLVSSASGMNG
jgi:serine/threonine-protein kinase